MKYKSTLIELKIERVAKRCRVFQQIGEKMASNPTSTIVSLRAKW